MQTSGIYVQQASMDKITLENIKLGSINSRPCQQAVAVQIQHTGYGVCETTI